MGLHGFPNGLTSSFSEGDVISAAKLNRIAQSYDLTKTQFSDGILYQGGPGGVPYTVQDQPKIEISSTPEQFSVFLNKDDLYVAKGRVIYRSSPNTFTGGCLKEFDLIGFGVVPTLSLIPGTETGSPWVDDNGYVTLTKPSAGGPDEYGVYIIANQYTIASGTLTVGYPYLAVMPVGGDAETKTSPWGGDGEDCDKQLWKTLSEEQNVAVETPGPPPYYEPTIVSGYLQQNRYDALYNYNCQRVRIASIIWNPTGLVWAVKQHLFGPITIPYNIFYGGMDRYESTLGPPPAWYTTPIYEANQTNWEGAFTDCDKWDGIGYNPTKEVTI